jgi:predicted phage terminase large subunit-like protein
VKTVQPSETSLEDWLDRPADLIRALNCADARESLADFCGLIDIPGAPVDEDDDAEGLIYEAIRRPQAKHHALLIDKLEAVERGELKRLMVFEPPGSAKSTYASVIFPTWYMGRKRRRSVGIATYAHDLARKIGRRARSIVKQQAYRDTFGTELSADSSAADEWSLTNESEFMGTGILGPATGNRWDGLIIDDPVKGRKAADSETIRQTTEDEYRESLKTRLKPGGWIVLIQTRWHELDLAGSILPEDWDGESGPILCRDGEVWEVLCIPAEAYRQDDPLGRKPGEMLWQEWFTADHWRAHRSSGRTWSALFQQRPQPDDGTYFQRTWFQRYALKDLPRNLRKYGTSDYAVTEDGGDYTVHRVWGIDHEDGIWLLPGGYRGQETSDKWIERKIELMAQHKPFAWFGEAGVIQKAIEPALVRRMHERRVYCRLEWLPSIEDKPTRARGFQARAAMGLVRIPEGPEGDAILAEYVKFPAGRNDDDVDNGSLIGRALDMTHPAIAPRAAPPAGAPQGVANMTLNQALAKHEGARRRERL